MTKKETLEICLRLWKWLAETGNEYKWKWPEWEENKGTIREMNSDCPCCEYSYDVEKSTCIICPLSQYAWDGYCLRPKGFYYMWINEDIGIRFYYAAWMVDAIERALEDLNRE